MELKPISKELKDGFIKHICNEVTTKFELEKTFIVDQSGNKVIIYTNNNMNSNKILHELNTLIGTELTDYIKQTTGEDAKTYVRSITLFESHANDVNLTITW